MAVWLGLDTAGTHLGIGLWHADGRSHAYQAELGRHLSTRLHLEIEAQLETFGVSVHHLAGVAVNRGPGSYTSLRLGLAAAKGLGLALGCPVVGIEGPALWARPFLGQGRPVAVWIEANAGDLYTQHFNPDGTVQQPLAVVSAAHAVADLPASAIVVGDGVRARRDTLPPGCDVPTAGLDPLALAKAGPEAARDPVRFPAEAVYVRPLTYRESGHG